MLGNDRFVIEHRLGEGSMGAVYLAYDRVQRSRVALKTLRRVDASGIYLFKREFRALADVVHPNLVRLHELFSQGDEWFFTMEYVRGRAFLDYVVGGTLRPTGPVSRHPTPLEPTSPSAATDEHTVDGLEMLFPTPVHSEERLRDVLQQITLGLMAVHGAGKLHRDLKPDNVMVTDEGRAVVLDFGVIIERSHDIHGTVEPTVFGTPAYMSPEQAASQNLDVASDWYSLGVMMFEALTGGLPFDGAYHDVLRNKQELDPPRPSHMVSGISEDLDELCVRLLARTPSNRPTGKQILEGLRQRPFASAPPGGTRPPQSVSADFVGREMELAELRSALRATDRGSPVACLVSGTSGIGKTTVIERFLQQAHHGQDAVVLKGRCYERESVPFKAVDSLIDSLCRFLRRLSPQQAAELLPRDIGALTQLFPVLTRVDAFAHPPRRMRHVGEPSQMRRRAFAALRELLGRLADRYRLVLAIDDLQWSDLDSAWLLREVLRGADAPALLLIGAYREDDERMNPCLQTLRSYVEDSLSDARRLVVGPLSEEESRTLLCSLLPEASQAAEVVRRLQRDVGGNPYLLTELLDYLAESKGDAVPTYESLVQSRVAALSEQACTLLRLISVAGRPVTEEVLSLATAFDINMQEALLSLRSQKLVRGVSVRDERAIEVYHNRIRQFVVSSIGQDELRTWNRRLATTLEATGSADLEALVAHLLAAGEGARAGLYALRAAEQAAAALAFDKAARLYAVAATHGVMGKAERHQLLMSWAETLESAGRGAEAGALYLEASKTSSPAEAASLRKQAGVQLLAVGELERGTAVLREALRRVGLELSLTRDAAVERTAVLRSVLLHGGLSPTLADPGAIPQATLERLDLTWAVAQALLLHDTVRAIPLLHQFAVEAIQAGDRNRIIKGVAYCDVVAELVLPESESQAAADGLLLVESLLCEGTPSDALGCALLARGMRLLGSHDAEAGLSKLRAADHAFSAGAELDPAGRLCRVALVAVESVTGHGGDLSHAFDFQREADAAGDHLLANKLRLLSSFAALRRDEPEHAHALLDSTLAREGDDDIALVSSWMVQSSIALYEADHAACASQVARYRALTRSLLLSIRFFSAHTRVLLARLLIFAAQHSQTPARQLGQADALLRDVGTLEVQSLAPTLLVASAALERQKGEFERALGLLKRAAAGPRDHVRACADYALSRLLPSSEADGSRSANYAESALRESGVECPARFSRLFFPASLEDPPADRS